MSYKIKLLPEARIDIVEIIEWYNKEKPGLGTRFYGALKSRFNYLKKYPLHFSITYRDLRTILVNKFPY